MADYRDELKKRVKTLESEAAWLFFAMARDVGQITDDELKKAGWDPDKLPAFSVKYERWYSVAMQVVKQILPDRLEDFVLQYKSPKRKEIDSASYGISDYIMGLERAYVVGKSAAVPRMRTQWEIVKAARDAFDEVLVDVRNVVLANVFDSELDAAEELARNGFLRAAGAMSGVVLERHLSHVCEVHQVDIRKKRPTINDFNQPLKDNDVVDTANWRFIQHLADLRNLCDHNKEREPTKTDIDELIAGVKKVLKTVQ